MRYRVTLVTNGLKEATIRRTICLVTPNKILYNGNIIKYFTNPEKILIIIVESNKLIFIFLVLLYK